MKKNLSRSDLIQLVTDIMAANGTEAEIDEWLDIFRANTSHPDAINLIFYPDRVPGIESDRELTPTEIVVISLAYHPICF